MPTRLSSPKLAVLRVAKAALALDEDAYRGILETYGGSRSATGLDSRGFDQVMARFRQLGFVRRPGGRSYGDRFNMATDAQLELIQSLFAEVSANPTDDHLTAWMEKHHKVSSLRFVTAAKAGQVIASLKAWKARKADA